MTSPEAIRIRSVGPDRARDVALVWRTSYRVTYPDFPDRHSLEDQSDHIATRLMPSCRVEAAFAGDEMVGIVIYTVGSVDQLYVVPGWQGQGIGTRLLQRAMTGARRLRLATFQVNARARAFYAHHGFAEIAWSPGDNEDGQPDVIMEWQRT